MKSLFTSKGIWQNGLDVIRIITGLFMAYHGWEVFSATKMTEYADWMTEIKLPYPALMAYIGKGSEFLFGVMLMIGFLTRIAIIPLTLTMLFIAFYLGKGKVFMEDQHSFLFVLLFLVFLFVGAGKWSLDYYLFDRKK